MSETIEVEVHAADSYQRSVVVASRGEKQCRDLFNLNDAYKRALFLDRVMRQLISPSEEPEQLLSELDQRLQAAVTESSAHRPGEDLPEIVKMSDVIPEAICWLWPGVIARGKLTMLSGDPGLGKSLVSLDLVSRVSRGAEWPGQQPEAAQGEPGSVLLLSAEDDPADTLHPRLTAAGADLSRVHVLTGVRHRDGQGETHLDTFSLASMMSLLEKTLEELPDCRLVVIDPISAYLQGVDSHRNAEVRSVLSPLAELAQKQGVAVLAINHLNKSAAGPALYRSMGSLAFVAAARAVWSIVRDGNSERRLMLPVKNNLGQDRTGLAYRIESALGSEQSAAAPQVVWETEPVAMSADEMMLSATTPTPVSRPSPREEASDWLKSQLADGPIGSRWLLEQAAESGIAERTVRRAFHDLGGKVTRKQSGCLWSLEKGGE